MDKSFNFASMNFSVKNLKSKDNVFINKVSNIWSLPSSTSAGVLLICCVHSYSFEQLLQQQELQQGTSSDAIRGRTHGSKEVTVKLKVNILNITWG